MDHVAFHSVLKLTPEDRDFANRLMANPAAGLAWAESAMHEGSKTERAIAARCALTSDASWSTEMWSKLHRARMVALSRTCGIGEIFEEALPALWLSEHADPDARGGKHGIESWIEALNDSSNFGVPQTRSQAMALKAVSHPEVKKWLAALSESQRVKMFDDAVSARSKAPLAWQLETARAVSPVAGCSKLERSFFTESFTQSSMAGVRREAVEVLAANVFSDPSLAHRLMQQIFFGKFKHVSLRENQPFAGVFDALVLNPAPKLEMEKGEPVSKIYAAVKPAISVAMEFMCHGETKVGLAAARWAKALGGGGREPVDTRTEGRFQRSFEMSVPIVQSGSSSTFKRSRIGVKSLCEAAFLMCDAEVCVALREMGWGWPSKARASELAAMIDALAKQSAGSGSATPLFRLGQDQSVEASGCAFFAFYESLSMERMLDKRKQKLPAGVKTLRI